MKKILVILFILFFSLFSFSNDYDFGDFEVLEDVFFEDVFEELMITSNKGTELYPLSYNIFYVKRISDIPVLFVSFTGSNKDFFVINENYADKFIMSEELYKKLMSIHVEYLLSKDVVIVSLLNQLFNQPIIQVPGVAGELSVSDNDYF